MFFQLLFERLVQLEKKSDKYLLVSLLVGRFRLINDLKVFKPRFKVVQSTALRFKVDFLNFLLFRVIRT